VRDARPSAHIASRRTESRYPAVPRSFRCVYRAVGHQGGITEGSSLTDEVAKWREFSSFVKWTTRRSTVVRVRGGEVKGQRVHHLG
jgi:hypothetical protein